MSWFKKLFGGGAQDKPAAETPAAPATKKTPAAPAAKEVAADAAPEPVEAAMEEAPVEEAPVEEAPAEEAPAEEAPAAAPAPAAPRADVSLTGSVLVVAEVRDGSIFSGTLSAIAAGKAISAEKGTHFDLLVMGSGVSDAASTLTGYGAQQVLVADDSSLVNYLAMPYAATASAAADARGSSFVVALASTLGKDLLPRVAVRIGAGMISEAVGIAGSENGHIVFNRPMWAGNVIASVQCVTERTVVSIRGTDFDKAAETGGSSEIVAIAADGATDLQTFVELAKTESERPDLSEASVVVTGGRGLKDGENFYKIMEPLADSLGAAIGASRAAVDAGFCPNDLQIGQTGKVVAPDLYIAVAISGAIQHLAGMKKSKTIVAINTNEEAAIFQVADYGLVADAFEVVPELAEKVKASKAG